MYDIDFELRLTTTITTHFEGFSPVEYTCPAGYPTIGYGRNLDVYPLEPFEGESVTKEQASLHALEVLRECRSSLMIHCPWLVEAPRDVRLIFTDMVYNLGLKGFKGFTQMLKAAREGNYDKAADELKDSKYFRQTGHRAKHHYYTLKSLKSDIE